jgi:Fe-S cluster assembly iron-binding protein IscA
LTFIDQQNQEANAMFQVTPQATRHMAKYFEDKDISPVRIFYNSGGCGPPSFAMALDEPNDSDEVFEIDGFIYVVNRQMLNEIQPITVDFKTIGFRITGNRANQNRQGTCWQTP